MYLLSELHASSSLWHCCGCVHDQQLHNYLTLLCCKQINGKSATSLSRRMYAKANPVRRSSPIDDLKYDCNHFSPENVRSTVAVDTGSYSCENGHAAESELPDKML
jgi:hypothetical protein